MSQDVGVPADTLPASRLARAAGGGAVEVGAWLRQNKWPCVASVALIVALYAQDFAKLVSDWMKDENYSHGFLVPVAFAWMVGQKRKRLAHSRVAPCGWGVPLIVLAIAQLLAGTLGAENFVAHTSLVLLLAGVALYLFGVPVLKLLLFPIAWLLFMIPLPTILYSQITFPLQLLASRLASGALDIVNVPNVREGNILYLSNFTVGVVEACSGIRSLISLLALASLLGYVVLRGKTAKWILALAAVPVAVFVNSLRVAGTGLVGNYWGPRWAEGFFHTFSGLMMFLLALAVLLGVARVLTWRERIAASKAVA